MFGIERAKAVKLGPGIPGVELPVDGGSGGVAFLDQGLDFPPQRVLVGEPLPQAGAGQHAELDFRHVQPTAVLGRVVELQPLGNPPGLWRWKGLVQRRRAVGVQVVQHHSHHRDIGIGFVHQPAHPVGEVLHRAPLGHRNMAPPRQGFAGQEQIAGPLPPVLIVLPPRASRLGRHQRPRIGQQLGGGLVKADHRPLGVIGFGVQVQHLLHVGHEVAAHPGDAPLFLLHGLRAFF